VFFTNHVIARWEGFLFLGYYAAYTAYLIMDASGHSALPLFSSVMWIFAISVTVVTMVVVAFRAVRLDRPET
jgi:cation:H+ antiporter